MLPFELLAFNKNGTPVNETTQIIKHKCTATHVSTNEKQLMQSMFVVVINY